MNPRDLPVSACLVLALQACATVPSFLCGYRGLNPGPHAGTESILLTELFTQHQVNTQFKNTHIFSLSLVIVHGCGRLTTLTLCPNLCKHLEVFMFNLFSFCFEISSLLLCMCAYMIRKGYMGPDVRITSFHLYGGQTQAVSLEWQVLHLLIISLVP